MTETAAAVTLLPSTWMSSGPVLALTLLVAVNTCIYAVLSLGKLVPRRKS